MLTVDAPGGDRLAVNGTLLVKVVYVARHIGLSVMPRATTPGS